MANPSTGCSATDHIFDQIPMLNEKDESIPSSILEKYDAFAEMQLCRCVMVCLELLRRASNDVQGGDWLVHFRGVLVEWKEETSNQQVQHVFEGVWRGVGLHEGAIHGELAGPGRLARRYGGPGSAWGTAETSTLQFGGRQGAGEVRRDEGRCSICRNGKMASRPCFGWPLECECKMRREARDAADADAERGSKCGGCGCGKGLEMWQMWMRKGTRNAVATATEGTRISVVADVEDARDTADADAEINSKFGGCGRSCSAPPNLCLEHAQALHRENTASLPLGELSGYGYPSNGFGDRANDEGITNSFQFLRPIQQNSDSD
ncbi:hypothetical protein FIBSPDRAFT_905032 [Athelia psychrophila]|uniref:Uncharacterized protein n=1 Tax=Athelia psychrophila TaxID=1759441 RepID=A0A167TYZ0_9AGAM|nr:hypothetical protein FIBSPDRAFT_905032 [Fibularhizoctonia sp. CBS 109695]